MGTAMELGLVVAARPADHAPFMRKLMGITDPGVPSPEEQPPSACGVCLPGYLLLVSLPFMCPFEEIVDAGRYRRGPRAGLLHRPITLGLALCHRRWFIIYCLLSGVLSHVLKFGW